MPSLYTNHFGIVTEGKSDYAVLKNILYGLYGGDIIIAQRQPLVDETGGEVWRTFGTWSNVFRYLSEKLYREDLSASQYLIVQIDTDVSELPGYDVSQRDGDRELEPNEIVTRVTARFESIIGAEDMALYRGRIFFAICVRDMECWLLPLWDKAKASKWKSCLGTLNHALSTQNKRQIPETKDFRQHDELSHGYRKKKILMTEGIKNPSLQIFLDALSCCTVTVDED